MNAPVTIASAYRQLSNAERAFVDDYVAGAQTQSQHTGAPITSLLGQGVSPAAVAASRGMLARPLVCAAISDRVREVVEADELTPRRLIREIMAVGFSNLQDYFTVGEDGSPRLDLNGLTRDQWAALSGIDIEMDPRNSAMIRNVKIKLHPKMDAIAKLGEYMAALRPDNPYWKGDQGRVIEHNAIPASASVDDAQNRYAAMINS